MVDQGGNGWCHCGTTYSGQFCNSRVLFQAEPEPETGTATITDCGTSATHIHFSTLNIVPNPPVKGSMAVLTANGTSNEAVTSASYALSVSLDGVRSVRVGG